MKCIAKLRLKTQSSYSKLKIALFNISGPCSYKRAMIVYTHFFCTGLSRKVRCIDVDQEISFKYFEQTNRMLNRHGKDNFIIFDFSRKVGAATVRKVLQGGIIVKGDEYQFIGCSSNGLKE